MRLIACLACAAATAALAGCGANPAPAHNATDRAMVTVPDVRGERPLRAEQLLTDVGLRAVIKGGTDRGPGGGQCVVAAQNPAAGAKVAADSIVTLSTAEVGAQTNGC